MYYSANKRKQYVWHVSLTLTLTEVSRYNRVTGCIFDVIMLQH